MSAHVLLNLLNELRKNIRCEAVPNILSVFPNEFNKYNNTGARMQDSIYHITLKSHFSANFALNVAISALGSATFLWTSTHNVTTEFAYLIH